MSVKIIESVTLSEVEGNVVIVSLVIAEGGLELMAEIDIEEEEGQRVIVGKEFHMHGEGFDPNALGAQRLIQIAHEMLEELGYDACRIEGGIRTTGASPGRRPKPVRFKRKRRAESR